MKAILSLFFIVFSPLIVTALNVHHKILADAHGSPIMPYITLYSTYTQKIEDTNAVQYLELNSHINGEGHFTQINRSTWMIVDAGAYELCFSGIADLIQVPGATIEMWIRQNNVDIPDSNTRVSLPTAALEQTMAICWIGPFNAGDTFNAMTYGDDVDMQWLYTAAGTSPDRPVTPSIIMTVKKVSGIE